MIILPYRFWIEEQIDIPYSTGCYDMGYDMGTVMILLLWKPSETIFSCLMVT